MKKLYCITGYKTHQDAPIINGHQCREINLEEAKDISPEEVQRLDTAISKLRGVVENAYRIQPIFEASKEYNEALKTLNNDNISGLLRLDRRFRAYAMEFDMFLDYWETSIAHYKRIDGSNDKEYIDRHKQLFKDLTHNAYDNHLEYQLLDMIRNLTAHVQSPMNHIRIGVSGNEAYADRDVLLAKCKNGKNKMNILKTQPKEIELTSIVNVTTECLNKIHDELIAYELDDLVIEECKILNSFIQNANLKGMLQNPWIMWDEDVPEKGAYHINDIPIYLYLLEQIQKNKAV